MDEPLNKILAFLEDIGLVYNLEPLGVPTFLPGLKLRNGTLVIDPEKLLYPGDILHEAGHLATMPPEIRESMDATLDNEDINQGGEIMAIAWSYAACIYLKIDPAIVFHERGYKGNSDSILHNFSRGQYFGVPLLQWCGMTLDFSKATELGKDPFPAMIRWTCETRPQ